MIKLVIKYSDSKPTLALQLCSHLKQILQHSVDRLECEGGAHIEVVLVAGRASHGVRCC